MRHISQHFSFTFLAVSLLFLSSCTHKVKDSSSEDIATSSAATAAGPNDSMHISKKQDSLPLVSHETPKGWKTYHNEKYGFSFDYPADLKVESTFKSYHTLGTEWRAEAMLGESGTAVVSIPIYQTSSDKFYPRFFGVELRVGVRKSDGTGSCLQASNGESSIGSIRIGNTSFDQFSISDHAMMKYLEGISYRTEHNGYCYAIEQLKSGSSYRDQPSKNDIPDAKLNEYYFLAGKIVKTFRFQ